MSFFLMKELLFNAMACPDLVSNCTTPRVKWYQTDLQVFIRIQVTDVHEYYLRVKPDHLAFSTTSNNKDYYLILYFYGGVIPEETVQNNVGREIKVSLIKTLKWYSWLRLTKSKEKDPFISYDQETLCRYQPQRKYAVQVQRGEIGLESENNKVYYVLPYESDFEESEDDECFYDI